MMIKDVILKFFYPMRCAFCGKVISPDRQLCPSCADEAVKSDKNVCKFCGLPKEYCKCGKRLHFYDEIACVYLYEGVVQQGILHYKKGGNIRAADYIAEEMTRCCRERIPFAPDYVACIPQTQKERKARGFDQNREIADGVAKRLGIPLFDGLVKLYETPPQKTVVAARKTGNVAGVFDILTSESVEGKSFVLTDDIKTSGSTLNECAKMLKLYGASEVFALTFAATVKRKES